MSFTLNPTLFGSNIYEVNIRQYTRDGTLKAFEAYLPRLRRMGVEILWFMPLTPISEKERKGSLGSYYATADYFSINPEFGTTDDFKHLVEQAHHHGFKVIIDWVANHTGWDHTWTHTNPEFYRQNEAGQFYERNGWEDVIDLNYDSGSMRIAMINAMRYWVDQFNIDGFRCDMAMLVPLDFWLEARGTLDQLKSLIWLAECEDPAYLSVFDLMYGWEWMHLTAAVARGEQHKFQLLQLLEKYQSITASGQKICFFTSNHDENSWNGTEYERYGPAALLFAALNMILPNGIPLIYSGQELPVTHRLEFFDKDEIPWGSDNPALDNFYTLLLYLRKSNQNIKRPGAPVTFNHLVNDDRIFSIQLGRAGVHDIIGIFNLSNQETEFSMNSTRLFGKYRNVLTQQTFNAQKELQVHLTPYDFRVYENTETVISVLGVL